LSEVMTFSKKEYGCKWTRVAFYIY
jgi:hypothetical protein